MFTYADPEACPVCRSQIPYAAVHCSECDTGLSSTAAANLWRTLTHADGLVAELLGLAANSTEARTAVRSATAAPAADPVAAPFTAPFTGPGSGPGSGPVTTEPNSAREHFTFAPFPTSGASPAARTPRHTPGLTSASVPKVLLGLGAGCLLVAAIVFLAVAWAAFGQTGRTVSLLALTAAAGGAAYWMTRQGLRAGAESLATVTFGLLVLDMFGADSADWFGALTAGDFALLLGIVVGVVGLVAAHVVRHGASLHRLISAEVFGAAGVLVASARIPLVDTGPVYAIAAAVLVLVGLTLGARRFDLQVSAGILLAGAACWWLALVSVAVVDLGTSFSAVWGGMDCLPMLIAAAIMLIPLCLKVPRPAQVLGVAISVTVVSFVLTLPVVDESHTAVVLVSLAVVAAGAGTGALPLAWRSIVVVPVIVAAGHLFAAALDLVAHATNALFDFTTWTDAPLDRVPAAAMEWQLPLLLPPTLLGTLVGGLLVARMLVDLDPPPVALPILLVAGSTLALLPASYGAPLTLAIVVLLLVLAAQIALIVRPVSDLTRGTALTLAVATACTTLGAALASDILTAAVTGLFAATAFVMSSSRLEPTRLSGESLFAPLLAGCAWTLLHLGSVDVDLRVPVILVLIGIWAILRPAWWTELAVLLTGLVTASFALTASGAMDQTWLAVDLTTGGALVTISALVNPQRRVLGWFGLALLTLAQWVRMAEIGITTPEAYTLPLATVLLVVGVAKMLTSRTSSARALTSALVLALAPSLLIALVEPLSLRAVLVGAGCAAAVALGASLRWSAPLVAGAVAGSILVLREATYAEVLPQWVTLGLIGVLLTVVGATWERRVNELRTATGFVRRLR
ncbi:MAG: hypothetical protein L0H93_07825 [Nocardioides sp.]|nr:hypothetical protein [Nocardioides sp.]